MLYIFVNGVYIENEEDGIPFEKVNGDLKKRIINQYVNLEDALSKGFINNPEYEELKNKYFCWRFSGTSGYKYDYLYPVLRKEDGSIRDDIFDTFSYDDKSGVNAHFKNEFLQGFQFESLQKIIDQSFTTQDEINEMKLILDEKEEKINKITNDNLESKAVFQATFRQYFFDAIFDKSGVISGGGYDQKATYNDSTKSFTCFVPESAKRFIPIVNGTPNYFLKYDTHAESGYEWDYTKTIDSFEVFQVNSLGERRDIKGKVSLRAYFHQPLSSK